MRRAESRKRKIMHTATNKIASRTADPCGLCFVAQGWRLVSAVLCFFSLLSACSSSSTGEDRHRNIRISVVNAPGDIVTLGAHFLSKEIHVKSGNRLHAKVYHSGVLSGGKGEAEIEMCQQGSIEIHITSTAYLANLVPKTSIVSLPFLFRDFDQMAALVKSKSPVLETINRELNEKKLQVIAWWPRGFRQLTNSKQQVKKLSDLRGLKLRVMNNPLYADNMRAMLANPVPMAWGEVYNGLQLKTIDGQENAEDVIYNSKLFEAQKYMTIWDYSIDFEVVLVNLPWWKQLDEKDRRLIQEVADRSVSFEEDLLRKNTVLLRKKIAEEGMDIYYLTADDKSTFKQAVKPVWYKYEVVFGKPFMDSFLAELEKY